MSFLNFSNKKEDSAARDQANKNTILDKLEAELFVLDKTDLSRIEGGKETKKPLTDISSLRSSIGGTVPL